MKRTLVFLGLCLVLGLSLTSIPEANAGPRGCCDDNNNHCTTDGGRVWRGPRECFDLR